MDRRRAVGAGALLLAGTACAASRRGLAAPPSTPAVPAAPAEAALPLEAAAAPPAPAAVAPPDTPATIPQLRAWWVDAFHEGIKTPAQVDALVRAAQLAGVNTLVVQVRRRGDAYYNRTAEVRVEDPALAPGFDALQAVIERAHAARLEVHAWIATVALWNNQRHPPADPAHTFNQHGPAAPGGDNWISLDNQGRAWDGDNYMLDPGHSDAARYMAAVAEELARGYDVDGVHLDLIRYAGVQWGYNPASVDRYHRRFGTSGTPAPADPRWQQWRRDQVTALVRRIYLDCLAVRPALKITAAVIGWGNGPVDDRTWRTTSAYSNVFQDWLGWLEGGIVDVALPMNYDDEANPDQQQWFDRWLEWEKSHQAQRQVAAGVGLFLNAPEAGLAQIRRALAPSAGGAQLAGVALYSYAVSNAPPRGSDSPALPNSQFNALLSGSSGTAGAADTPGDGQPPPFAVPATPPPMPWKDNPGAYVRGTATWQGQPLDGATVRFDGPSAVAAQTDGSGYFGAPDLFPGTYTVTLVSGGAVIAQTAATLPAGLVTTLDLTA